MCNKSYNNSNVITNNNENAPREAEKINISRVTIPLSLTIVAINSNDNNM